MSTLEPDRKAYAAYPLIATDRFLPDNGRSAFAAGTALDAPQPTFTLIADLSRGLCRVNKRHSRSASLEIDKRKSSRSRWRYHRCHHTIPGDRAAISELPQAIHFPAP